jgi:hypothetical protein
MIGNVSDSMKSAFEAKYNLILSSRLGFGFDGEIFLTNSNTAVKFFKEREKYSRERRAYEIIMQCGVTRVLGHEVPQLRRADDELMAIEINLVRPPFLLDFASAHPESEVPDFPEEVWAEWQDRKLEEFGDRWPQVQLVLAEFQHLTGLVLLDVNPGNIRFTNEDGT